MAVIDRRLMPPGGHARDPVMAAAVRSRIVTAP
jgi:hypothetical protein